MKRIVIFISAVATIIILLLLLSAINSEPRITNVENGGDAGNTENGEILTYFLPFIAESLKAPPMEKSLSYFDNGIFVTRTWTEPKRIPVDPDSSEVAEYVQIARIRVKDWNTPPSTDPIVEIQGEAIVVTFPCPPDSTPEGYIYLGPDFLVRISIDIKTKAVLEVLLGN
jgi:hypothetical protein